MKLFTYVRRLEKSEAAHYALEGMAGVLTLVILGVFAFSTINTYLIKNGSLAAVISAVLVDLTNGDRTGDNLGGLTVSPQLTAAAQAKANDMAAKGYFAHTSPDGKSSWYWFAQAGYTFTYAGENLAVDFTDSVDVENAWMNSPGHRANILNEHFTQIGIATAEGTFEGHPTTFVVQMFGTPAPARAQVAVETVVSPTNPTSPALATATPKAPVKAAPKPVAPVAASTTKVASVGTTTASTAPSAPATTTAVALVTPPTEVLGASADSILPVKASWWEYLVASPKTLLATAYGVLTIVILVLLGYVTRFELHRRHMHHAMGAAALFVVMAGLFALANFILFTQPVVAAIR